MNPNLKIENFSSGRFEKTSGYIYFVPELINRGWNWDDGSLNALLERASIKLGELNSFARLVPNIDVFIQMHVTKEALISSRIEGTKTKMDEALLNEDAILPERRNDWREVKNYTNALNDAIIKLETLPVSSRLLRQCHSILMQGVRGENKMPGEFRTSQNWIGGSSLSDAVFIPPLHTYINELMSDLESFLHNDEIDVPLLIRIGIAHYQFETIHPFLDGNGRIGRLLITLYLVDRKILEEPLLYLSAWFEKNKSLYYDNLTFVRSKNNLLQWLKYFLAGVEETAAKGVETLSKIIGLKKNYEEVIRIRMGRRSNNGLKLLEYLFTHPTVTTTQVKEICNITTTPANELVSLFEKTNILKEISGGIRYRVFIFEEYVKLFGE